MATTREQTLLSAKARAIAALDAELKKLETEQLRLGRVASYIFDNQAVLSAKCAGINQAIAKLLS